MFSLALRAFARGFLLAFIVTSSALLAQTIGSAGTIQGRITDPSGAVIPGATVDITNPVTGYQRTAVTDNAGSYLFRNIPQNTYHLSANAKGFTLVQKDVDVRTSVPISVDFTLPVATSTQQVEVTAEAGDLLENDPAAHTDLDNAVIARIPMEQSPSNMSSVITMATPGVAADSNGFFHPLGDHAQANFSIDNQPITDQQSRVYSNQISTNAVQSMEVINGVAPPEYGDKTSLVAVIVTKSGLGQMKPTGSFSVGYGSFGTPTASFNLGVGSQKWGNFFSANGMRSGRYLDSPEFRPLHDIGNNGNFFDRLDFQPDSKNTFHLDLFGARAWFQTPNTIDQQNSGQDQRQMIRSWNIAPGWTHLFSPELLLTANGFVRQDQVRYYPSADPFADQPGTISQTRRLTNTGGRLDLSYTKGIHNLRAGFQFTRTSLSEAFQFGITDPTNNPVCLDGAGDPVLDPTVTDPAACVGAGFTSNPDVKPGLVPFDLTRGGSLFSFRDKGTIDEQAFYVQDTISGHNASLMVGVRGDNYDGLSTGKQLSPRVGFSYNVKKTNTILRASYGRFFETPYNENLLLSSATGAGGLAANVFGSTVNTPIRPGRRNHFSVGFQQALGKYLVVDAEYFWKYTKNAYDFNVLENTSIAFPIAWNKSKLDGAAIRISMPEYHGFRAFTVMGHTRARYFNPEVGGLFFDVNPPTGVFRIDHDQAFQQTTSLQYSPSVLKKNAGWLGFTWRYDSGLVSGAVPDYATALTFTPAEQAAIGLFCGSVFATPTAGIASCSDPRQGATRIVIPAPGTEDDDRNPPRVAPRHLFDIGAGIDNLFRTDRVKWNAKFTVVNVTNHVALYNFQSTFSGTHFVTPRAYTAEVGFTF
jgi:hypothetical protein